MFSLLLFMSLTLTKFAVVRGVTDKTSEVNNDQNGNNDQNDASVVDMVRIHLRYGKNSPFPFEFRNFDK